MRAIANELLTGDPNAVEAAVRFVCAKTVNLWHNRGPAMMCRRMKHVDLSRGQQGRLVAAILGRLASGNSERFRHQLRLAMPLGPSDLMHAIACLLDDKVAEKAYEVTFKCSRGERARLQLAYRLEAV